MGDPGKVAPVHHPDRSRRPYEGFLWAMTIVLVALGVTLYLQNRHTPGTARFFDPVLPAMALTFPATAALLASRGGRSPVTWLFSAAAVSAVSFFAEQYAVYALITNPGRIPAGEWATWLATWTWAPAYLGVFTLLPLLFPDGRVAAPGWRPLLWTAAAAIAVTAVSLALAPENLTSPAVHNPVGVKGLPAWGGIGVAVSMFVLAPLAVVSLIGRYRLAQGAARRQLSGVTLAFVVAVAVPLAALGLEVAGVTIPVGPYQAIGLVGVVAIAGAPVVAAVRHGLYDFGLSVNTVVGRVLVYAALGAVVAVTYGALDRVVHRGSPRPRTPAAAALAVLVAGAVGRGLHPGFQRRIDRFLYRKRGYRSPCWLRWARGCGRRSGPDHRAAGHRRNGGIGVEVALCQPHRRAGGRGGSRHDLRRGCGAARAQPDAGCLSSTV